MKWTASVVALISIIMAFAFSSESKADPRVLVSQNDANDADLDSPDLFVAPNKTQVKPMARKPKSIPVDDVVLDDDKPSSRPSRRMAPSFNRRKPASEASTAAAEVVEEPKVDEAIEAKIDEALTLEEKKEFKQMLALLQPLADRLPHRGLMALSRAANGSGDINDELKVLQLALAKNPKDYVVQTQLGEVYSRLKKSDDAVNAFQAAIELNKRFEPAYEDLWMELEKAKQYYEARSTLNDMMKYFGEKPKFYSALCRLYSFDDYLGKAMEICKAAIEKDPKHAENYVHLAVSLRDTESAPQAEKLLQGAAERFPASESVQTTTGSLYLDKKDYGVAYRYYKQATKADDHSTRAWVGLANTAFELQKNDEALEAYSKACILDRKMTRDLRIAISKLRTRKDTRWEMRYEARLLNCE